MLKNKETYIIYLGQSLGYIHGGTFKIGGNKYAKLTHIRSEAKRYTSKKRAIAAAKTFMESCANMSHHFFIEEEDGFQSWRY